MAGVQASPRFRRDTLGGAVLRAEMGRDRNCGACYLRGGRPDAADVRRGRVARHPFARLTQWADCWMAHYRLLALLRVSGEPTAAVRDPVGNAIRRLDCFCAAGPTPTFPVNQVRPFLIHDGISKTACNLRSLITHHILSPGSTHFTIVFRLGPKIAHCQVRKCPEHNVLELCVAGVALENGFDRDL